MAGETAYMMEKLGQNWGLKIISLILAVGLWYYALGEESIEITRTVPLEIKVQNPQMSILRVSAQTVQVTLSSPRGMLSKVASEELRAYHTIGKEIDTAGDYTFRLESRDIHVPAPYIQVAKIEPEIIHVTLDELIIKKLEIRPDFLGEPAFGYKVREDEIQLNPNAILIEGPKAQLEGLDFVRTKPVDLVGRIRSFRRTAELNLPSNVRPLSEAFIDVFIPIKEEFDEKRLEGVRLQVLEPPGADRVVELDRASISFVLKGSRRQLEKVQSEKTLAFVDTSALDFGTHERPVELVLPEEVSLKDDTPVKVRVTIRKSK